MLQVHVELSFIVTYHVEYTQHLHEYPVISELVKGYTYDMWMNKECFSDILFKLKKNNWDLEMVFLKNWTFHCIDSTDIRDRETLIETRFVVMFTDQTHVSVKALTSTCTAMITENINKLLNFCFYLNNLNVLPAVVLLFSCLFLSWNNNQRIYGPKIPKNNTT